MMNHNGLYSLTSFSVLFIKSNAHQLISSSYHLLLILEIMTSFGPFNNVSYSSIHSVKASPINERFDFYWQICIILTVICGHFLCHTWNQLNCCKRRINCQWVCFIHIYYNKLIIMHFSIYSNVAIKTHVNNTIKAFCLKFKNLCTTVSLYLPALIFVLNQ